MTGGILVNLDVAKSATSEETAANLESVINVISSLAANNEKEKRAKADLIQHFREEQEDYLSVGTHIQLLKETKLTASLVMRSGNAYLLKASK